jgi:hypothetical protein
MSNIFKSPISNNNHQQLKPISEDESPNTEPDLTNKILVEISYFPDTLPSIKSYYMWSHEELETFKSLHMDLYIENFLNNEDLTKEKIDIYVVNNPKNIEICRNFLNIYSNPFDIKMLINDRLQNKNTNYRFNNLEKDFSEFGSESISDLDQPIVQPKNKHQHQHQHHTSESDSDEYIETMTEIIETYNKSKQIDESKLEKLATRKPELLNDLVLNELVNKKEHAKKEHYKKA